MHSLSSVAASLTVFTLCACQTIHPTNQKRTFPSPLPATTPPSLNVLTTPPAVNPHVPTTAPTLLRKTIHGIEFEGVAFDSRSHRLAVIDQPRGPGSEFATSEDVACKTNALLAINAGFFTPEGKPLGLVISDGRRHGAWNSASSLGSGIFAEDSSGHSSIFRRISPSAVSGARELIQAGPLLIENGNAVGGLDGKKAAVRSLLFTDGAGRWWIGKTSVCTLASLGNALASASPAPWRAKNALNLDGGRSTDLFVSAKLSGGPVNRRGFLNRPVRNFLILTPRQTSAHRRYHENGFWTNGAE